MANLNKVMLIGRLTRDPESRSFSNGGKVVKIGFAVSGRKKNQSTGQWEDDPVFVDVEFFNRGDNGTLADRVESTLKKGSQIFIEGRLKLDQWNDKEGNKRSKLLVTADNFQYLEAKGAGESARGGFEEVKREIGVKDNPNDLFPAGAGVGSKDEEIPF